MNCNKLTKKLFAAAFFCVLVFGSLSAQQQATRRIGLFVGANDGGSPEQQKLDFAQSDAEAVSKIFFELGGINQKDNIVLPQPAPARLSSWLEVIKNEVAAAKKNGQRTELIFYYAGHFDGDDLNLGSGSYPLKQLSRDIEDIKADAQIVILDMCYAGGATRSPLPLTFPPPSLFDVSSVLTSTDVTELSREIPDIRSTYFTHSLITGLRGAADVNGDSKVSFKELYEFVSEEVRIKTKDKNKPQSKSKIPGSEETALTNTSRAGARFTIGSDVTGRIRILDNSSKIVVSDVNKEHQSPMELTLDSGDYQLMLFKENSYGWAKRQLRRNQNIRLQMRDFVHAGSIDALRKKIAGRGSEVPEFFLNEAPPEYTASSEKPVSIDEALEKAASEISPRIPGDAIVTISILQELSKHPALSKIIKEELTKKMKKTGSFEIVYSSGEEADVIKGIDAHSGNAGPQIPPDQDITIDTVITVDAVKVSENIYYLYVKAIDLKTRALYSSDNSSIIWPDRPSPSPQGFYVDLGGGYSWLSEAGGAYESVKINLAVNKFFTELLTREFGVGLYGTVSVPLKITEKEQGTSVSLVRPEYDVFGLDFLIGPAIMLYKSETIYLPLSAGLSYSYLRIKQQLQDIEKNKHVIGLGTNISGEYHFHPHIYGYARFQLDFGFYSWGNTGEKELSGPGLLFNFAPGIGIGVKW